MHICEKFHENILTQLLKPYRKKMWKIIMLANIKDNIIVIAVNSILATICILIIIWKIFSTVSQDW